MRFNIFTHLLYLLYLILNYETCREDTEKTLTNFYTRLVNKKQFSIDWVPEEYRDKVKEKLAEMNEEEKSSEE
jgi:non-homologous end joining protein Ku